MAFEWQGGGAATPVVSAARRALLPLGNCSTLTVECRSGFFLVVSLLLANRVDPVASSSGLLRDPYHRGSRLLLDLTSSIAVTGSLHRRSHLHRFAPLQSLTFRPSQLLHRNHQPRRNSSPRPSLATVLLRPEAPLRSSGTRLVTFFLFVAIHHGISGSSRLLSRDQPASAKSSSSAQASGVVCTSPSRSHRGASSSLAHDLSISASWP
ncbi:hypothetical protein Bca4012_043141 [Brassica carinata]|uniref:Uncharacterized protein n=1 Tax=Brassica carinata TaxID=52824 RepID=A0A8X7QTV8_BRACI|nr:hypothetical protein Bca52824_059189 [Brassica carinata]